MILNLGSYCTGSKYGSHNASDCSFQVSHAGYLYKVFYRLPKYNLVGYLRGVESGVPSRQQVTQEVLLYKSTNFSLLAMSAVCDYQVKFQHLGTLKTPEFLITGLVLTLTLDVRVRENWALFGLDNLLTSSHSRQ